MSALRSGIMNRIPRIPPTIHTSAIRAILGLEVLPSLAHMKMAGRVKIAPAATDSPAEPMV